ncbi:MAG: hypothetical protein AVDCRST_MAG43-933 [uncultured Thermomicrobiales bacterium]|uniref:DUF5107 domain-containing protein n=1 Tax=uncultured Thermomicrobiales bacterium TaxID=1645740 RepID=A0A6J4UH72_9BACT|nr:MAG: hypothetical protein AVDCRST_MAG43-933 [uncultured Thermomicrobiales bacterium]
MTVRFSADWRLHGLRALVLENRQLRVTVLPELGGKIWSIVSKRHDREMLWHHPRMAPRPAHYGATYDNWFSGGWDEVFPNDYPVTIDGEPYPDHGEVWSLPMTWHVLEATDDAVSVALEHRGIAIPTRFRKVLTLEADEPHLRLRYEIANEGHQPLKVHWKLHPALPIAAGARLHLPVERVIVDEDFSGSFAQAAFRWPHAPMQGGGDRDMRWLPDPDTGDTWFLYGVQLHAGYCAVSYPEERVGFGVSFDPDVLTSVWIFGTFGGWRNLSTIILEPCTGYPARLDQAIQQGSVLTLEPRATLSTTVVASVLDGEDAMTAFEDQGGVR